MPIGRLGNVDMRQLEPGLDARHDVTDRKRPRDNPAIGRDAGEAQLRRPGEAGTLRTRQASVPPATHNLVHGGAGVMRVNENVDV